ncbi:hypothetical protein SCT_1187 [Sulfuricella sp. T08]|nr:hypothetical protein SCT_1187 [Sulfuricella sp. T08]
MKPADGRCDVLASVSGFTVDPQDPECSGLSTAGVTVSGTQAKATKANGDGETVTINPDGTRTITRVVSNVQANTTTTTNIYMAPNAQGVMVVTGVSGTTVPGTGTAAGSGTAAPATPIVFPTDYNREATQTAIKSNTDTLKTNSEAIKNEITTSPGAPNGMTVPAAAINQSATDYKAAIDGISTAGTDSHGFVWDWSPIIPSATCAPPVINFAGKSITVDWCPTVQKIRDFTGYAFYLFTAYSLFGILTARRED